MKKIYALLCLLLGLPGLLTGQVIEGDFEQWEKVNDQERPAGWSGSGFGVGKISDAYEGNSAVSIWQWYGYVLGMLVTGEDGSNLPDLRYTGVPINYIPSRLTGYYKYDQGMNEGREKGRQDSGAAYILLKVWNQETGGIDTVGFATHLFPQSDEWQAFEIEIPLFRTGLQPDSIVVAFFSSNPKNGAFCGPDSLNCSYLSVDALSLVATSGVTYPLALAPVARLYPNPVRHAATVEFEGKEGASYQLYIFNSAGREVEDRQVNGSTFNITRSSLPAGAYTFVVLDEADLPVSRGEFVVD